jgi:hypothetical protein
MGLSPELVDWIDLAQSLFIAGWVDGQTAMRDASLGWEGQVLATLRVATDDATRPAELLAAHICWVNTLRNIGKSFLPADDIEHLVTVGWHSAYSPGNHCRDRLTAGGRWIRTSGTAAQKPRISAAFRALRGYRRGPTVVGVVVGPAIAAVAQSAIFKLAFVLIGVHTPKTSGHHISRW